MNQKRGSKDVAKKAGVRGGLQLAVTPEKKIAAAQLLRAALIEG